MSRQHLADIRSTLERNHWQVIEELPGNDYDVSAVWKIARPDGSNVFHLEFEGLDDMSTLPIEQAYAIKVREAPEVSVYFGRASRSWPEALEEFFNMLKQYTK